MQKKFSLYKKIADNMTARLSSSLVMFEQEQQKRNKTNPIFVYNSITTLFRFSWCENTANFFCLPISSLLLFFNYVYGKGLRAITEEHRNFLKEVLYRLALSYLLCGVGGFLRNQISDKTL